MKWDAASLGRPHPAFPVFGRPGESAAPGGARHFRVVVVAARAEHVGGKKAFGLDCRFLRHRPKSGVFGKPVRSRGSLIISPSRVGADHVPRPSPDTAMTDLLPIGVRTDTRQLGFAGGKVPGGTRSFLCFWGGCRQSVAGIGEKPSGRPGSGSEKSAYQARPSSAIYRRLSGSFSSLRAGLRSAHP